MKQGEGESQTSLCANCLYFNRFFIEFGQNINYIALYSNPTGELGVWGALSNTNPTVNKEEGKPCCIKILLTIY